MCNITEASATLHLKFPNKKQLDAVFRGLGPEASSPINKRVKIKLFRENAFLTLNVVADDTVALRAALNAYLRWIHSMTTIMDKVASQG